MDLPTLTNGGTGIVNPRIPVSVQISTGYTIGEGGKQAPVYAAPVSGFGQLQALDGNDLRQLDGLDVQGVIKALYLVGNLSGVIRPEGKGGDLVTIAGYIWLVVKVLEGWTTGAPWTKAAIVMQGPA